MELKFNKSIFKPYSKNNSPNFGKKHLNEARNYFIMAEDLRRL